MLHLNPHSYTLPGRLLLLVSLLIPVVGLAGCIWLISTSGRSGRYPVVVIAAPLLILSFVTFAGGAKLLRRLGVRVQLADDDPDTLSADTTPKHQEGPSPVPSVSRTAYCSTCDAVQPVDDDDRCLECRWPV